MCSVLAAVVAFASVMMGLALRETANASIAGKKDALAAVEQRQSAIEDDLAASNDEINGLIAAVSEARERETAVAEELDAVEVRLEQATGELASGRRDLEQAREQLREAVAELENVLVGIYKSGEMDAIKLLLESAAWDDSDVDSAYLQRVQDYQSGTVARVEGLRDEVETTVERLAVVREGIAEDRAQLAARRQLLTDERVSLEAQEAELAAARNARRETLQRLAGRKSELEDGIDDALARQEPAIPPPLPESDDSVDVAGPEVSAPAPAGATATLNADGTATPPADAPPQVVAVIEAANSIEDKPYLWGGGHGGFEMDTGYDCSGAISFALNAAGLIDSPLDSTGFTYWGEAGEGNWITVYGNSGHAYAVIAGLRWDTSGTGGSGVSWSTTTTSFQPVSAFTARHPAGY